MSPLGEQPMKSEFVAIILIPTELIGRRNPIISRGCTQMAQIIHDITQADVKENSLNVDGRS